MIHRLCTILTLGVGLSLVLACQGPPPEPVQESADPSTPDTTASTVESNELDAVTVGPWADYPSPDKDEWATEPLSLKSWATTSAELACAGRAFLGDPQKQRRASQRILHHHSTTAEDVMAYGINLNADADHALTLGGLVAEAAERCR